MIEINDILEQAKTLSPEEREELITQLIAMQSTEQETKNVEGHWGQSLNQLLDKLGPIDLLYPEIEDPVKWVKQIRRDQAKKRGLEWGDDR